jgi:hypothetical protein
MFLDDIVRTHFHKEVEPIHRIAASSSAAEERHHRDGSAAGQDIPGRQAAKPEENTHTGVSHQSPDQLEALDKTTYATLGRDNKFTDFLSAIFSPIKFRNAYEKGIRLCCIPL